jgi:hypothetical protein
MPFRGSDWWLVGVKFYPIFVQHMLAGTSSACA